MEIKGIEKVESKPDVNISLKKPFVSDNNKEHHDSDKGFKGMLNESIEELKKEDESFEEVVEKEELSIRDIQLMELSRIKRDIDKIIIINDDNKKNIK